MNHFGSPQSNNYVLFTLYAVGLVKCGRLAAQQDLNVRRHARTSAGVLMRKRLEMGFVVGVTLFGAAFVTATLEAQARSSSLVGTWRIVRYCDRDSTGSMVEPLGPNPAGLFVYTSTGQLSIQAMRTPPSGPLAGEPIRLSSLAELRPFYFGYFGTYSILSDSTVVHHVEGGTFPDYIGRDQPRRYVIRGDTLSIGAPLFLCRILIRAK